MLRRKLVSLILTSTIPKSVLTVYISSVPLWLLPLKLRQVGILLISQSKELVKQQSSSPESLQLPSLSGTVDNLPPSGHSYQTLTTLDGDPES